MSLALTAHTMYNTVISRGLRLAVCLERDILSDVIVVMTTVTTHAVETHLFCQFTHHCFNVI